MKILVVGGGGREHTLLWKLAQSPKVKEVFCAPGNAGTAGIAINLDIEPTNISGLIEASQMHGIELVVVGPENPLADGIVNRFGEAGIPIFGPTREAAQIEASKIFAYKLMEKYNIPCPSAVDFSDFGVAVDFVKRLPEPPVIKADGLAKGKGVTVCDTIPQALETLNLYMNKKIHGSAGERVLVQKRRFGREASMIGFTDGYTVGLMPPACDYKRVFDGDRGANTGGMGSYCPSEFLGPKRIEKIQTKILIPILTAMREEGRLYRGAIYAGLIFPKESPDEPEVLEVNARFGDPETQVQLPLLKTDLADIILAVINGTLDQIEIEWSDEACVGVVMASRGYPDSPETGFSVFGLDALDKDILVFQAGTKLGQKPGEILTSGGRALTVVATGTGKDMREARDKVYAKGVSQIKFEGCHYRKDIAELPEAESK